MNIIDKIKGRLKTPYKTSYQTVSPFRGWLTALILIAMFVILNTSLLVSTKPFTTSQDLFYALKTKASNQGVHFLLGMISGFVFSHPASGMTVGILKEIADLSILIKHGELTTDQILISIIDVIFWSLGSFAGYYGIDIAHYFFGKHDIRGVKDLSEFLFRKIRPKKKK